MTETIRVKCGAREGLLSLVTRPFVGLLSSSKKDAAGAADAPPTTTSVNTDPPPSPEEILAERLFSFRQSQLQADPSSNSISASTLDNLQSIPLSPPSLPTNRYTDLIDPTMHTDSLLHLNDLTLPDPYFILPILLTTTMATGILLRSPSSAPTPLGPFTTPSPGSTPSSSPGPATPFPSPVPAAKPPPISNMQRIGLSVSLLFGIGATQFPAAVLLYLVPNMTIGWVQKRWLDVRWPVPGVVEPCRRPVRVKVRKEFELPA